VNEASVGDRRGDASARISNQIVAIVKRNLGRGPTRARTVIRGNLVVCLLEDSLTRAERSLADDGRDETVRELRREFQAVMETDLRAAVESVLGRRVIAFMNANHTAPDYMAEVFVLDADADDDPFDGAMLAAVLG